MKNTTLILAIVLSTLAVNNSYSQCDTGTEPSCKCETAPVLCTITELDGYVSSMSTFQHPEDGPWAFCGIGTQADNPNWFGFIAWCSDFTMEVLLTNCTTIGGWEGVQLAIFEGCYSDVPVACNSVCNGNGTISLQLNNLTIGEIYYFMMDGCSGAVCDYEISVDGLSCAEEIPDWTSGISGPEVICESNANQLVAEELTGVTTYHWFFDGSTDTIVTDTNFFELQDYEEGFYILCVDVSNECYDVDLSPAETCRVFEIRNPKAGEFTESAYESCPGEIIEVQTINGYEDQFYQQYMVVTDESNMVVDISNSSSIEVSSETCSNMIVYSLNIPSTNVGILPTIGQTYTDSDCAINCCDVLGIGVSFEDTEAPVFINPPIDYSLSNVSNLEEILNLETIDNCQGLQTAIGTETIQGDACNGGTIIREWAQMDPCGNLVTHSQSIFLEVPALPQSILGDDVILDCENNTVMLDVGLCDMTSSTSIEWINEDGEIISNESTCLITEPGIYELSLSDINYDCGISTDQITISYDESFALEPLLDTVTVIQDEEVYTFSPAIFFDPNSITDIVWETDAALSCYDCLNPSTAMYEQGDSVLLTIYTGDACVYTAQTILDIDRAAKVYFPNIFNPDQTENFTLYSNGEVEIIEELYIYDRSGNLVFRNSNFLPDVESEGWNGRFKGEKSMPGVYIYLFEYRVKEKTHTKTGDITLMW